MLVMSNYEDKDKDLRLLNPNPQKRKECYTIIVHLISNVMFISITLSSYVFWSYRSFKGHVIKYYWWLGILRLKHVGEEYKEHEHDMVQLSVLWLISLKTIRTTWIMIKQVTKYKATNEKTWVAYSHHKKFRCYFYISYLIYHICKQLELKKYCDTGTIFMTKYEPIFFLLRRRLFTDTLCSEVRVLCPLVM